MRVRSRLPRWSALIAALTTSGCGQCEDFSTYHTWIDTTTCQNLEAGGDCMPICEERNPGVEFRSCVLDDETDCANARVECETTELACK